MTTTDIAPEEVGILHAGLSELIQNPALVAREAFRQVVHTLATCAFVAPLQRGESAPRAAMDLVGRFAPPVQEEWGSLAEAARRTGIPHSTLRRWCAQGRLPEYACRKVGRNWQVEMNELELWLAEVGK